MYNWNKMIGNEIKGFKILDYKREGTNSFVFVKCPYCGNKKWMRTSNLMSKKVASCGCREGGFEDLTERRFGLLTAKYPTGESKRGRRVWHCTCECGGMKDVPSDKLINGYVISCGCLDKKSRSANGKKAAEKVTCGHCVDGTNYKTITAKKYSTNTSGIKGVSWRASQGRWRAYIVFKGKRYERTFEKKEDAISWRKEMEDALFGGFFEKHKELLGVWEGYKNQNDAEK